MQDPLLAERRRAMNDRLQPPPRMPPVRRLIVNADDFGNSAAINEAVAQAHTDGILTTASLMVNGPAAESAVEFARRQPSLGVGIHLTLVMGRSSLSPEEIPGLVDRQGEFRFSPVAAGMKYFFVRDLRRQLLRELEAQFARFRQTGLDLDHVNGHLNLHLHPSICEMIRSHADAWEVRRLRLTHDPFWLDARLSRGNWAYRISHAIVFALLSARARPGLKRAGIRTTQRVFGLLQNANVTESYLLRLLPQLPPGDSELYSHPSVDDFRHELDALVSPRVGELVTQRNIRLIRYQDL